MPMSFSLRAETELCICQTMLSYFHVSMQSTYTGVYARGGPTNTDGPKDLSQITNRKPADNRGVARAPAHGHAAASTPALTPRRMSTDPAARSRSSNGNSFFGGSFMSPSLSCTGSLTTSMLDTTRHRSHGTPRYSLGGGGTPRYSLGGGVSTEKSAVSPALMQLPGWESLGVFQPTSVCFLMPTVAFPCSCRCNLSLTSVSFSADCTFIVTPAPSLNCERCCDIPLLVPSAHPALFALSLALLFVVAFWFFPC
jgi:hypothetical protein